ncbi:hypothetical protein LCGC14_1357990 [marine sediment metagenome]|uniref:Uncharacterized protein n=1 Tax=marine sediment metagenome TaxID=412755 RepID=A0A0F9K9I0_9ZZZZ
MVKKHFAFAPENKWGQNKRGQAISSKPFIITQSEILAERLQLL